MNRIIKKELVLVFVLLTMFCLSGCFSIKKEIAKAVEGWEKINGISVESYTYTTKPEIIHHKDGSYSLTINWDGFDELNPDQMKKVVKNWNSYYSIVDGSKLHTFSLDLDHIISHGKKYSIFSTLGDIKLNGITVVEGDSASAYLERHSSNSNSNNTSQKTATCNYCNGSGKVDGSTCPWCNGSGRTYDNAFNDMLK